MGGGASSKKKSVEALRQHRNEEKGGRVLNKIEWNVAAHGPDPDEVELADIIACLSEYYKRHEPSKRRRVCGEVDEFIDNLGGLFRSLQRTYGELPRIRLRDPDPPTPRKNLDGDLSAAASGNSGDVDTKRNVAVESESKDQVEDPRPVADTEQKVSSPSTGSSPKSVAAGSQRQGPGEAVQDEQLSPIISRTKSGIDRKRRGTILDSRSMLKFSVREPEFKVKDRLQILRDCAAEVLSYVAPEIVPECKKSQTKTGDNITVWPDGTKFQQSSNGTTVLVLPTQRIIQKSADKIIMKRPNGTMVQRSVVDVFSNVSGYIINQKTTDGLQSQFTSEGFREDFEGGSYLQIVKAVDGSSAADFMADPISNGRIEEHRSDYHLVIDNVNGRAFETRTDGTQINSYSKEGISTIIYKDGLEIQVDKDGHTMQKSPDGTVTQQNPDGSIIEAYFDGTKVHYRTDESVVEEVPGQYVKVTEKDGTVQVSYADHSHSIRRPDGTFLKYDAVGACIEHSAADGSDQFGQDGAKDSAIDDLKRVVAVPRLLHDDDAVPEATSQIFNKTSSILGEIISTEKTYISELEWVTTNFCDSFPAGLNKKTCDDLTPAFRELLEEANQFLCSVNTTIEQYASENNHYETLEALGDDFCNHFNRFRTPYARNMRSHAQATSVADSLLKKQLEPATKSLIMKLKNKLIFPVQRCMRYYMLLQQVLKRSGLRSTNTNVAVKKIVQAYHAAKDFATHCNTEELQGQSALLGQSAPKLGKLLDGKKLMFLTDLCKASKNATRVQLFLYNNGLLVQKSETGDIKGFDICAPTTRIYPNFRSSKKSPSLELTSTSVYPKTTTKKTKRGWLLRASKRKMLSRNLQIRELEKLHHLMAQLVNNSRLEASVREMKVPASHRSGYETILKFKRVCEEDMVHGFISDKEYDRLLRKVVVDCENKLRSQGLKHHLKIPISVVAQEEDFELRDAGKDMDLTPNFEGDLDAAVSAIRLGRMPIPVRGAFIQDKETGRYHHIVAAWVAGNI